MFTLDLIINPIVLVTAIALGVLIGFSFRKRKLAKMQSRVHELEEEMMASHAEILEIQKAYVNMENNIIDKSIPVIPMKHSTNTNKDNPKGKASK